MEDIRPYSIDLDETLRERDDAPAERASASLSTGFAAAKDDELPFEIPRD